MPVDNPQQEPKNLGSRIPPFNPRFGLIFVPVAVFWLVRRLAGPEIAIGAGFAASLIVFAMNRNRGATDLGYMDFRG